MFAKPLAACTHLSATVSQLFELQVPKIAVFTYRSLHFCFPWRRPCDYHEICCMDGKTIKSLPNPSQHVPSSQRQDLHSWLTYLLCCTVEFIVSVSDLFLDIMSGNEVSRWPRSRPRTVVARKSGKVWNVLGVLLVYKWRSFDRSFSFPCGNTIERFGMCDISHQFTVGERVFGD